MQSDPMTDERLVALAQAGDQGAKAALCERHRDVIARVARRWRITGTESTDVVSIGMFALLRAILRYNPERGPFRRWAAAVINNALRDAQRTAKVVHSLQEHECGSAPAAEDDVMRRLWATDMLDSLRARCGANTVAAWLMWHQGVEPKQIEAETGVNALVAVRIVRSAVDDMGEEAN